jgi:hypothetical protein
VHDNLRSRFGTAVNPDFQKIRDVFECIWARISNASPLVQSFKLRFLSKARIAIEQIKV